MDLTQKGQPALNKAATQIQRDFPRNVTKTGTGQYVINTIPRGVVRINFGAYVVDLPVKFTDNDEFVAKEYISSHFKQLGIRALADLDAMYPQSLSKGDKAVADVGEGGLSTVFDNGEQKVLELEHSTSSLNSHDHKTDGEEGFSDIESVDLVIAVKHDAAKSIEQLEADHGVEIRVTEQLRKKEEYNSIPSYEAWYSMMNSIVTQLRMTYPEALSDFEEEDFMTDKKEYADGTVRSR